MESDKTRNRCQIISDLHSPKFVVLLLSVKSCKISFLQGFLAKIEFVDIKSRATRQNGNPLSVHRLTLPSPLIFFKTRLKFYDT